MERKTSFYTHVGLSSVAWLPEVLGFSYLDSSIWVQRIVR